MGEMNHIVVFTIDNQRYALRLSDVKRIVRTVEVTALPQAPEGILGVVNVEGQVIPVVNIRRRFNLPEQEINLDDQLIIARTSGRAVALVVDAVSGIVERSEQEVIAVEDIVPGTEHVEGVIKLEGDMILIPNLDSFLSLEEENSHNGALPPASAFP